MDRKSWADATGICGFLDIAYAMLLTVWRGGDVSQMLRGVASGPFGDAANGWGVAGSVLGLTVHFVLMGIMVGVFLWLRRTTVLGRIEPWLAGAVYGLALYLVMYGIVLPLRFAAPFPIDDPGKLLLGLVPHVLLVGVPMALTARVDREKAPA